MNNYQSGMIRRVVLIVGAAMVAAVTFTVGQASATPVQLGMQHVTVDPPGPPPPPAASQTVEPVGQECMGTVPEPGSTPARPVCDWNKIFAATDARARDIRQQHREQFQSLSDDLRPAPGH
jgi:hypothetical protein